MFLEKNALVSLGVHELFFLVSFESVFLSVSAFLLFFFPRLVCFWFVFPVWRRLFCFFFPRACVFGRFFEFGDVYSVFFFVRVFLVRFSSIATLVC